jgi:hypothetical protein
MGKSVFRLGPSPGHGRIGVLPGVVLVVGKLRVS